MSSRYEIFLGSNSQYYFRLKAENGQVILQSEGYVTKAGCTNGVESVRTHSPYESNYVRKTSSSYQPYFVLKAVNNQVIGVSEMYSSTAARDNGIESVKRNGPNAVVIDLTTRSYSM